MNLFLNYLEDSQNNKILICNLLENINDWLDMYSSNILLIILFLFCYFFSLINIPQFYFFIHFFNNYSSASCSFPIHILYYCFQLQRTWCTLVYTITGVCYYWCIPSLLSDNISDQASGEGLGIRGDNIITSAVPEEGDEGELLPLACSV